MRDDDRTREDRATQPMDAGWLSFANMRFQMLMLMLFGTSVASRRVSLFETMKYNSRADPCWSAAGKKKSLYG